jgi:hypothetical protein
MMLKYAIDVRRVIDVQRLYVMDPVGCPIMAVQDLKLMARNTYTVSGLLFEIRD